MKTTGGNIFSHSKTTAVFNEHQGGLEHPPVEVLQKQACHPSQSNSSQRIENKQDFFPLHQTLSSPLYRRGSTTIPVALVILLSIRIEGGEASMARGEQEGDLPPPKLAQLQC